MDFGEQGIAGVTITLTGTDNLGHSVSLCQQTDSDGAYVFLNLRPGSYYLTRTTQPAATPRASTALVRRAAASWPPTSSSSSFARASTDSTTTSGAAGPPRAPSNPGRPPPSASGTTRTARRCSRHSTAAQGDPNWATGWRRLYPICSAPAPAPATWRARPTPSVAALFQSDFLLKGVKLDAQVLSTALSVYVTNATLDPTKVAAGYGFHRLGRRRWHGDSQCRQQRCRLRRGQQRRLTVLDLLLSTNSQAVRGVLYNGNATLRNQANAVYSAVNQAGDIS